MMIAICTVQPRGDEIRDGISRKGRLRVMRFGPRLDILLGLETLRARGLIRVSQRGIFQNKNSIPDGMNGLIAQQLFSSARVNNG